MNNTGPAILVIGAIWLHLVHGLKFWITVGTIAVAAISWLTVDSDKELKSLRKEHIETEIRLMQREIEELERGEGDGT